MRARSKADRRRPRVLVEPSDYVLRNIGDMAMLQVAVSRLSSAWPDASIQVLTDDVEGLRELCPGATPVAGAGRRQWFQSGFLPGNHKLPRVSRRLQHIVRTRTPGMVAALWRLRLNRDPSARAALDQFVEALSTADLVVVAGMGGIADAFPDYARSLLDSLWLALAQGKTVAMVGQGFGPLTRPDLLALARDVLPRVHLFGLREERASRPLLLSLGVSAQRIMTTGDDALEPAYRARRESLGTGLGVNLRVSGYSGVDDSSFAPLRRTLQKVAGERSAALLPLPVSRVSGEADEQTIARMFEGTVGGTARPIRTPLDLIEQVQRCRVVVTGSYHAAVFALASGIPAIGLAQSPYYVDKFEGLSALFGEGSRTVRLDNPGFAQTLERALGDSWSRAEQLRPLLLAETAREIRLGEALYARLCTDVERR